VRILLVNDYGTETGGAEIQLLLLRRCLRERGHEALLFSSGARPGGAALEADVTCFGTVTALRTPLQVMNPWAATGLARVIDAFRPDIVHVGVFLTQLSPSILPVLRDVPALLHAHWYRPVCPLGTKRLPDGRDCSHPWGTACLENRCLRFRAWAPLMLQRQLWRARRGTFDRYIACGEAVRERLVEAGFEGVRVIWNGVPVRPARAPLSGPPVAVFAGRMVPEKGVQVLIDAFARVVVERPDARLILAGDGPERSSIEERIVQHRLSGHVECTGWLHGAALDTVLERAWLQVVPSLWVEPFGLTVAEAMMRGTAVVASARGGPAELVRDGVSGILVEPDSSEGLAGALLSVLGNRELAEAMGRNGRLFALERLSETVFADRMIETYHEMLGYAH
jgi:glycosyltransferase involved in cell wall biosynthesis